MNKRLLKKKGLSKITNKEVWDLDVTLSKYILPRLIKFKSINTMSYPCTFGSLEVWHLVIDKMIWSFEKHLKDDWDIEQHVEEHERYIDGMNLFAKHFGDLWD